MKKSLFFITLLLLLINMEHAYNSGRGQIQFLEYTDTRNLTGYSYFFSQSIQISNYNRSKFFYDVDLANIVWISTSINFTQTETILREPIDINLFRNNQRVFVFIQVNAKGPSNFMKQIYKGVEFSRELAGKNWAKKELRSSDKAVYVSIRYRLLECDDCNFCLHGEVSCEECSENYYPAGQCSKFCEPETNRYTCTSEGEIQCLENREGHQCKDCKMNFYGESCKKFCQDSQNFTCNDVGDKVCEPHFYPENNCSTYCSPVEGRYSCDNITGAIICTNCTDHCKPNKHDNCSEVGDSICLEYVQDNPEERCMKSHFLLVAGLGGALALTGIFVFTTLWFCSLKKKRSQNIVQEVKDDIYDSLDTPSENVLYCDNTI